MGIKSYINVLLAIIILHLILSRINSIARTVVGYDPQNINLDEANNSINFLLNKENFEDFDVKDFNDNDIKNNPYGFLNEYAKTNTNATIDNTNNTPNFNSNVMNVPKFYNIQPNADNDTQFKADNKIGQYDGLTADKLKPNNVASNLELTKKLNGDNSATNWKYVNDLPMNGGNIMPKEPRAANLVGFDPLESSFADYCGSGVSGGEFKCNNNFDNKPDDIRMGLGIPNKPIRQTN